MKNKLSFSNNWNGKLNTTHFTTIRLDTCKYSIGKIFELYLKDDYLANVKVISVTNMKLSEIEKKDVLCYTDTGYDGKSTRGMLDIMYKKNSISDDTIFSVILLQVVERFKYVELPKITEKNSLF